VSAVPSPAERCANGECARPAESGERYCSTCGLERSLFDPEARRQAAERRADGRRQTDRR
jgi:hypothetical protein